MKKQEFLDILSFRKIAEDKYKGDGFEVGISDMLDMASNLIDNGDEITNRYVYNTWISYLHAAMNYYHIRDLQPQSFESEINTYLENAYFPLLFAYGIFNRSNDSLSTSTLFDESPVTNDPLVSDFINDFYNSVQRVAINANCDLSEREYTNFMKWHYVVVAFEQFDMSRMSEHSQTLFLDFINELLEQDKDPVMHKIYGFLSYDGSFPKIPHSWEMAEKHLKIAMENGIDSPDCANALGYIYYYGRLDGTPDYEKAFIHYSIGSHGGNNESLLKLSDMYKNGLYPFKDYNISQRFVDKVYFSSYPDLLNGNPSGPFADAALRKSLLYTIYAGDIDENPYYDLYYKRAAIYALEALKSIGDRVSSAERYGDISVFFNCARQYSKCKNVISDDLTSALYDELSLCESIHILTDVIVEVNPYDENDSENNKYLIIHQKDNETVPGIYQVAPSENSIDFTRDVVILARDVFFADNMKKFVADSIRCEDTRVVFATNGEDIFSIEAANYLVHAQDEKPKDSYLFAYAKLPNGKCYSYNIDNINTKVNVGDNIIISNSIDEYLEAEVIEVFRIYENLIPERILGIMKHATGVAK